jgi:3-dehydroquinate synthase
VPRIVPVELNERSYLILIEPGSLKQLPTLLRAQSLGRSTALITNQTVEPLYGSIAYQSLSDNGRKVTLFALPDGEEHKSFAWAQRVYDHLLDAGMDRSSLIVAIGGGVVGDLSGFVAATYMRGIPFVLVPTTLLAQVDASVGGKVAVNHPRAKNLIGAFHQPAMVVIDPLTLRTLPPRELRAGLAEVVKYGVIADAGFFSFVESRLETIQSLDADAIGHVIERSCQIKAAVVAEDEREESGRREILNYGHTFGHAIETVFHYRYLHGEAVAIGMTAAANLAARRGLISAEVAERQEHLLRRIGLPVQMPAADVEELLSAMRRDKKVRQGRLRLVLPVKMGEAQTIEDVSEDDIRGALQEVMVKEL